VDVTILKKIQMVNRLDV